MALRDKRNLPRLIMACGLTYAEAADYLGVEHVEIRKMCSGPSPRKPRPAHWEKLIALAAAVADGRTFEGMPEASRIQSAIVDEARIEDAL